MTRSRVRVRFASALALGYHDGEPGAPHTMRTFTHKRRKPERHRPTPGGLAALRQDLAFAVGVVTDVLLGRPFVS